MTRAMDGTDANGRPILAGIIGFIIVVALIVAYIKDQR